MEIHTAIWLCGIKFVNRKKKRVWVLEIFVRGIRHLWGNGGESAMLRRNRYGRRLS